MPSLSHTHTTPAAPQTPLQKPALRVKTHVKAGGDALTQNHNATLVRTPRPAVGLRVKTHVKAGGTPLNHNATLVRSPRPAAGAAGQDACQAGLFPPRSFSILANAS